MCETSESRPTGILRYFPVWLFALTFPLIGFGAYMATTTFENDFARWPVGETEVRQKYDWFQQTFESTDILIVSWPGCQLDDDRLVAIVDELDSGSISKFIQNVSDGHSVYGILTNELGLSAKQAMRRLRGSFVGPDEKQTSLYLALNRKGTSHRYELLVGLQEVLQRHGIAEGEVKLAGPAFNMHSIDMEGFWSPLRAAPLIALLSFLLTWLFVRRLALAVFISAMSIYTGAFALTIVYISGHSLNTLVWTMPSLVLLLTTSAALHFLGYYRQAVSQTKCEGNTHSAALKKAWRPIVYCAVTTAVGLFSLTLSKMTPVQQFGVFGGISVLASAGVVLGCLPIWLLWFPNRNSIQSGGVIWEHLARFAVGFRWPIIVAVLGMGL